jgi:hypothetical protein
VGIFVGNLKEALFIERNRLFVGREKEIQHISAWMMQPQAASEVIFVSGMGGIGKSALLLQFLSMAQDKEIHSIWMDGSACKESPNGFVESLHDIIFLGNRTAVPPQKPMQEIIEAISGQRTLLCIDNYDPINRIEGWLREVFLPEFPAVGFLMVLAGRQKLSLEWQNDMAWRGRLKPMRLEPLSPNHVFKYFSNLGLDNREEIESLVQDTHGHPLAMALVADNMNRAEPLSKTGNWPVSRLVSAQLLREVVTPDLHQVLDVLSILPHTNQEILNRLLPSPLTADQFYRLTQLSFIRPTLDGFALHDVARAYLFEDFSKREPQRFDSIRRRIINDARIALKSADAHEKNRIAASLLSICKDALPQQSFSVNPAAVTFDNFQKADLPQLHRLLNEEHVQKAISLESEDKAHELLDELALRFPESIRLCRSDSGVPLMFHAGLLLYRDTFHFLGTYIPNVLEACFPIEAERISQLLHEEADTYFHFLGGVEHHDETYTADHLYKFMFNDGFSRIVSMGIRFALTTNWENLKLRFLSLGFDIRSLHNLPLNHPAQGDQFLELDLRTRDFGEWVSSFLEPLTGKSSTAEVHITPDDIKTAFHVIEDIKALENTVVARWLTYSGVELQGILRKYITSNPPPAPLTQRSQHILQSLGAHPAMNADESADLLHISRATYYRHLHDSLHKTLQLLTQLKSI